MYGAMDRRALGWSEVDDEDTPFVTPARRPDGSVHRTKALAGAMTVVAVLLLGVVMILKGDDRAAMAKTVVASESPSVPSESNGLLYEKIKSHKHAQRKKAVTGRDSHVSVSVTKKAAAKKATKHARTATATTQRSSTDSSSDAISLDFSVQNKYGTHVYKDSLYPWLNGKKLVEPYFHTTFTILKPAAGVEYNWLVEATDEAFKNTYKGNSINLQLTTVGLYNVTVTAQISESKATVSTISEDVWCKYVRREIRDLLPEDREAFFDAAHVLWEVPHDDGKELYGDDYLGIHYFTEYHLNMAAQKYCDHMHDGLGFMTEHTAMTQKFEQTLRLVDPSVSVPYWDYSIDYEYIKANYGGNFSQYFFSTAMFTEEYFGAVDPKYNTVTSGRWAWKAIPQGTALAENSYGMMRAPWNSNPSKYVSRSSYFCGYGLDITWVSTMPTCSAFYNFLAGYNDWYDFGLGIPFDPHGASHALQGGAQGCDDMYDTLISTFGLSESFAQWLTVSIVGMIRYWWRDDIWTCASGCTAGMNLDECRCSCDVDDLLENTYDNNLDDLIMGLLEDTTGSLSSEVTAKDDETKYKFAKYICGLSIYVGDQIEASSPYDISFWPMHPTIERLWAAKKLRQLFTDESWPSGSSSYSDCSGHDADDDVPVATGLFGNNTTTYTNQELYDYMDPSEPNMPHVFDNFDWAHCLDVGVDFSDVTLGVTIKQG